MMARSWILIFALLLAARAIEPAGRRLVPVSRERLCVTEGEVEQTAGERLAVSVPKMRAYLNEMTAAEVEADFKYLGATGHEARLGSGEMRRQFGLKLRAADACNLVYVMWRIEPESKIVVSVKTNPGQHTSAECGNRGYRNIKARRSAPVAALRSGDAHVLRAAMNGAEMNVWVDGRPVWEGSVGNEAMAFDGPVGMRSDNAKLEIQLRAPVGDKEHAGRAIACRAGETE